MTDQNTATNNAAPAGSTAPATPDAGAPAAAAPNTGTATAQAQTPDTAQPDGQQQNNADGTGGDTPITYAEFTVPEGYSIQPEMAEELTAFAAAKSLSQEEAQKLVDMGAKVAEQGYNRAMEQMADFREEQIAKWGEQLKNDPEFGGDKFAENLSVAQRGLAALEASAPGLTQLLNETGFGNHPVFAKAFRQVGAMMLEDGFHGSTTSVARTGGMYDYMNQKTH